MKYIKSRVASSHVDRHGDKMSVEVLKKMVVQINAGYSSFGVEHDPRISPVGRVESASLIKLDDGEYAVEATIGIFELGSKVPFNSDDPKELIVRKHTSEYLGIVYDRAYFDEGNQLLINEINSIFKSGEKPKVDIKKSLEPISILTITGTFLVGGIALGFTRKIGADLWDLFKNNLKTLFEKNPAKERLLSLNTTIQKEGYSINVEIILSDPNSESIDYFLEHGIKEVDGFVAEYFHYEQGMRRMVFEYRDNKIHTTFAVLKGGEPVSLDQFKKTQ
jgi:hypothetical protein